MVNSISQSSVSAREHLLFNERVKNLEHMKSELNRIHWGDFKQAMEDVRGILQSYHSNKDDWIIFCKSKQGEGYSRNEIIVVPNTYTLVLMVWKPLIGNFIHHYCGSPGLVKILDGRLVEEHYSYDEGKEKGKRLKKENEITLEYNEVNDHNCFKDFHRMYNPNANEVAVSLHVYAPPLETCTIINKESNVTEVVQMKCASRRGEMTTLTENNELSADSNQDSFGEKYSPVSFLRDVIQKLDKLKWSKQKVERKKDIRQLLDAYDASGCACDWSKYCQISTDEEYSRTIIHSSTEFTLSLNFYRPGADCGPHDHDGADCIYKVLEGQIEEKHFNVNELDGDLELVGEPKTHVKNEVNNTAGSDGYHSKRNPSNKEHAITLNVYTYPEVKCRVYEPESKSSYDIGPNFHTTDGLRRRQQQKKPESNSKAEKSDQEHKAPLITKSEKRLQHTIIQTTLRIALLWLSLIALIFALTVLVILCIEMRGIVTKQGFQREAEVEPYSRFCFKCTLVGDYPDHHPKNNPLLEMLNNLTRHKLDDHNSECCVENYEQFKALVTFLSASLITKQEGSHAKSSSNNLRTTPVSAHMQLVPAKNLTDKWGAEFPLTMNTSYHDPSYEHVRGVDVTTEGFIVKFSGMYLVYASVQFSHSLDVNKTLYHYLLKTKKKGALPEILLRSVHTTCQGCMQSQETYFFGIFFLECGEKIHMSVSAPAVVNDPTRSMYMGLAMLTTERPTNFSLALHNC